MISQNIMRTFIWNKLHLPVRIAVTCFVKPNSECIVYSIYCNPSAASIVSAARPSYSERAHQAHAGRNGAY